LILRRFRTGRSEEYAHGPRPLSKLGEGESGTVVRIVSREPDRVVKLSSLGVMPGVPIRLVQRQPAVVLQIAETTIAIDREVADEILVEPVA
jgi:DtxR family Mn-dependent transcriptional regulator